MPTEPAHTKRHDGGEADGLEEEGDVKHGHARVFSLGDGRGDEDDACSEEEKEDLARADEVHDGCADEAANGECPLSTSQELSSQGGIGVLAGFRHVVDEVTGNGNLRARVAELGKRGVEEAVLFPEWLVGIASMGFSSLVLHVCVGDLGQFDEEEDDGKDVDKDGDGQVHPLHVLEGEVIVETEEDVRSEHGGYNGTNTVESLGKVDADFRVLGRAAYSDVRVGGRLERAQTVADDEDANTEAGEGLGLDARDREKGAEAIEEETPDKDGTVAEAAKNVGGMAKGSEGVGTWEKKKWLVEVVVGVGRRGETYPK